MTTANQVSTTELLEELKRQDQSRNHYVATRDQTIAQLEILRGEMADTQSKIDKMQCGIDMSNREILSLQERLSLRLAAK